MQVVAGRDVVRRVTVLAEGGDAWARFEELFGDPDADYQAVLDQRYQQCPPPGGQQTYVSAYATMHPAEDWAETFAHYLHIRDALDTAAAFGFAPAGATLATPLAGETGFRRIAELWLPLAWSLNMVNRSMGHPDLYPFVLPPAALEKMSLVHQLVAGSGAAGRTPA
nr:putative zinc-binding metallopeptidase [Pseudofrankia sp. DC12]